ncbi:MAG: hypothetical protein K0S61_4750 [Anaerocolumna sp.]|jgi:hypothetical protein|nr:hypothetical protein [Anaerocolumna sp.]
MSYMIKSHTVYTVVAFFDEIVYKILKLNILEQCK